VTVLTVAVLSAILTNCVSSDPPGRAVGTISSVSSPVPQDWGALDVHMIALESRRELLSILFEELMLPVALLPPRGIPSEVQWWFSEGHAHVRVDYEGPDGRRFTIVQAEALRDSLTEGERIRVRGERGVVADRSLYWQEDGYLLALSPVSIELAESLRWRNPN
jgi:hypothetical protein